MAGNNGSARPTGLLVVGSMILGIVLWGGFNTAMEATNVESFCISCHEMEENVYQEYQDTIHFNNRTGVRATCPDCHVPKPWIHKMIRKIKASREVYSKLMGLVDTPEKFEENRMRLATNVWNAMESTNSRECRNCHSFEFMDFSMQGSRGADKHEEAVDAGKTCINCHKGIAHKLPEGYEPSND